MGSPSQESTTEPDTIAPPRKRIRMISSDSGDDTNVNPSNPESQSTLEPDSQETVGYSLGSQQPSDVTVIYNNDDDDQEPLTDEQKKKIEFLRDCFTEKSDTVPVSFVKFCLSHPHLWEVESSDHFSYINSGRANIYIDILPQK